MSFYFSFNNGSIYSVSVVHNLHVCLRNTIIAILDAFSMQIVVGFPSCLKNSLFFNFYCTPTLNW